MFSTNSGRNTSGMTENVPPPMRKGVILPLLPCFTPVHRRDLVHQLTLVFDHQAIVRQAFRGPASTTCLQLEQRATEAPVASSSSPVVSKVDASSRLVRCAALPTHGLASYLGVLRDRAATCSGRTNQSLDLGRSDRRPIQPLIRIIGNDRRRTSPGKPHSDRLSRNGSTE